ncbi:hypothetical protein HPP92_025061 [Vanilla planifolia]|uniref:Uncharacterized protein n=1 Tax=Vanilla planifolia TaxID=51239 RepID=A0A835U9U9_VANPL|nr:hypothetical protein HPP92_025061 [Vanilla planifolia]
MSLQQQLLSPPPPPPPATVYPPSHLDNGQRGSIGPLIGVLTVIIVLGVIACLIGRLCSGRRIAGIGQYDVEGWMERNCASCINGLPAVVPPLSSSVTEGAAVDGAGSPRIEAAQP